MKTPSPGMMLQLLRNVIVMLPEWLDDASNWDSLIVNRRKPFTYRVFRKWHDLRVCLHKFDVCHTHESFPHPHPWPGAFAILEGSYKMDLFISRDREDTYPAHVSRVLLNEGSSYEIVDPMVWHTVTPLQSTYTVMINGEPWPEDVAHVSVRTTKGKDLDKMPYHELVQHLQKFKGLLHGNRA